MRNMIHSLAGCASLLLIIAWGGANAGPLDSPGATKALVCSACHGFGGNSRGDMMPILAGMSPSYFTKAIQEYAEGRRPSPEMQPYAKMVLQLGADEIAQYFASQKPRPPQAKAHPAAVSRGKTASAICAVCHGPEGKGNPETLVPSLRGQPAGYLKNQMLLFKQDKRSPADQSLTIMKGFMKYIADKTFDDLAAYYSSLR